MVWPCAECSASGAADGSASSSLLKAVLQEPAMCEGLPAQQAIPHSCDEDRELSGATPASSASKSTTASVILAITVVRAVLTRRETESKGKTPFRRVACGFVDLRADSVTGAR